MFDIHRKELLWGGRKLVLETGKIARQANGAVVVSYGETVVLATVVAEKTVRPGTDFVPLTVNYQEKYFAAGKIPGGFFKREGRPTEKETLVSRLIDRPLRPLFAPGFRNETQVICTVLSFDNENDSDIPALIGASAALTLSGIPFLGPVGGCRVGFVDGQYVLNPSLERERESRLDLVVAGTSDGVLMVESEARELTEEEMLGAVMFGHEQMQPVIRAIIGLAESAAHEPWPEPTEPDDAPEIARRLEEMARTRLGEAYRITAKQERQKRLSAIRQELEAAFAAEEKEPVAVGAALKDLEKDIVRTRIIEGERRIDGRGTAEIRPIVCEVGILPRAHGSALFTRGETQSLAAATLGTGQDEQIMDVLEGEYREHFLLHYNFPPYSVGEASVLRGPGRREIGHGKLAWRATRAVLPKKEDFPYTVRVVSEITESNGSSSMATVCGTALALMDAGVPIARPVAGIAMGLIKEGERFAVLSDILGDEDHLGDMDFKVAGTSEGVTALQMDIKITGITREIMQAALAQAREGRLHILSEMAHALGQSRADVSRHAPRIVTIHIPKEKIREVIGPGGKIIRELQEKTSTKIDIEDDGTIKVAAVELESADKAVKMIRDIVAEAEVGVIYEGTVVKIVDFGAFVNFIGNRDGLVHISELAPRRVEKVTDIVKEGDKVKVKVLDIDERGKVRLSMRVVDQATGADITEQVKGARGEAEGEGGRGRGRGRREHAREAG
ncbi:MAG TPA: polyribonucleotide nucleotidyltransferase [Alphaproteobacteria bacterium]|nr:polyribonucleotide nucleotidyltransferase [Alphaproteobacteria bacterium]